ncbi:MAG: hypothetical protein KDC00_04000 [Flavobacteriales bacterium]|nr:hypothetical protein [Flavobacteriales bacterium]
MITPQLLLDIATLDRLLVPLSHPSARWVIAVLHLLFLTALFSRNGILEDKEALKYVGCAQEVLRGDLTDLSGNYLKYASYVVFLIPFVAIGSPEPAVLAQIVLGILAAWALAQWTRRLTGSQGAGTMAMTVLLLSYPIQQWALALYTEYFFTSILLLFLERISRHGRPDKWSYLLALIALTARPVGLLFVFPAFIWKLLVNDGARHWKGSLTLGSAAVLLLAILLPGIEHPQLAPIAEGHVVAGIPTNNGPTTEFEGSNIASAQVHLLRNMPFSDWLGLTMERMTSFFTLHRPWYSNAHNMLIAPLYALYPLALFAVFRRTDRDRDLLIQISFTYAVFIGLTHDEWSGRFLVPLLPTIILLAVLGAYQWSGGPAPPEGR